MNKKPKLLIIGYARHGKDTVAEILSQQYGYTYMSSSQYCAEKVVYPVLKPLYNYQNAEECFQDRVNHRKEWFDLITSYNYPDRSRLGKSIFEVSHIYCGLRNYEEFLSLRDDRVFDYSVWVDRSQHLPPEDESSNTLYSSLADLSIDNNGTLSDLRERVTAFRYKIEQEYNNGNPADRESRL